MALRLRRGTQAERDDVGFIPESGEPVWTIDTKKLYIGDGTTPGGNLIQSSGGGGSITGITDNTTGSVITLDDTTATFGIDIDMDAAADITLSSTSQLNGSGQISLTGNITGNDFSGNAATFASVTVTGSIDGDMNGSIFGDDSTLIVDAVNNVVSTANINGVGNLLTVNTQQAYLENPGDYTNLRFMRRQSGDIAPPSPVVAYGTIRFERDDDAGEATAVYNQGGSDGYKTYVIPAGAGFLAANALHWSMDGKLGVGKLNATEKLDVDGNAVISGNLTAGAMLLSGSNIDTSDSSGITVTPGVTMSSDLTVENNLVVSNTLVCDTLEVTNFTTAGAGTPELTSDTAILLTAGTRVEVTQSPFKLASFTNTTRDALSAENGDMIYNTTNNRPEMYVNGAWKIVDTSPIV